MNDNENLKNDIWESFFTRYDPNSKSTKNETGRVRFIQEQNQHTEQNKPQTSETPEKFWQPARPKNRVWWGASPTSHITVQN